MKSVMGFGFFLLFMAGIALVMLQGREMAKQNLPGGGSGMAGIEWRPVLIDDEPLQLQRIRHLDAQRIRLYGDGAACTHRDLDAARVQAQGKVVGQLRHYP